MGFLHNLIVRIKGDNKNLEKSLKNSGKSANKLGSVFKRLGGILAGVFAIRQLVRFGAELIKIAAKTEGIEKAFNNLNDPNLLKTLVTATHNTVSNLELMQKAVQANNF